MLNCCYSIDVTATSCEGWFAHLHAWKTTTGYDMDINSRYCKVTSYCFVCSILSSIVGMITLLRLENISVIL